MQTVVKQRLLDILVREAPDLPGVWLAHCLDLDVISQGATPVEAVESVKDAVRDVIEEDYAVGRDPFAERRTAPDEDIELLLKVIAGGSTIAPEKVAEPPAAGVQRRVYAVRASMRMELRRTERASGLLSAQGRLSIQPRYTTQARPPEAWMIADPKFGNDSKGLC